MADLHGVMKARGLGGCKVVGCDLDDFERFVWEFEIWDVNIRTEFIVLKLYHIPLPQF